VRAVAPQPGGTPEVVRLTVTVADAQLGELDLVAARLREAGMTIDQVLGELGIITGSATPACRAVLAGLPGVDAVEDDRRHRLPPPDADVQ
jgi:hypothetical protein